MKWFTPLCQQIVADKRFSRDQRDVAVLWVGELSGLCDKWVPQAPAPFLEYDSDEGAVVLSWVWKAKFRTLTLYVERNESVWMQMLDDGRARTDEKVTHDLLKLAVQCFFEGWVPTHVTS